MAGSGWSYLTLLMTWLLLAGADVTAGAESEYRYHVNLDPQQRLLLRWGVDYARGVVVVRLEARISDSQWLGVGFSDYGDVTNADFAVTWTDESGQTHFRDAWTDDKGFLFVDETQNYFLQRGRRWSNHTVLEFYRHFDTCDHQDYTLDNGTTHIVYFIGDGRPASIIGSDVNNMEHGLQRAQLLKPDIRFPPLPPDTFTVDILAPKVRVPAQETTYWWYVTKFPKLRHKHHVVKYAGVIQPEHEGLVHHMEVFHCEDPRITSLDYSGPGMAEGKPPELASCRKVIGAWAMGASALSLPEEAGIPVGGQGWSPYVMLEVHYNNPDVRSGLVDSSGIRFWVTSSLRQHDAGVLEVGLEYTDKMAMPPAQPAFHLRGYCIQECTRVALPSSGIHIFASQLHTHLTGKRVLVQHVREGEELAEINRDNHYSPHFQEIRALPRPVHFLPGDAMIVTCEDSTVGRSNVTLGGFAITEEMCVSYLHYFPHVTLEVCKSSVETRALQDFFAFMNRWEGMPTSPGGAISHNYAAIQWTPLNVHLLRTLYAHAPLSMQCNQSNGMRFPGDWEGTPLTRVTHPLPPPPPPAPPTDPCHRPWTLRWTPLAGNLTPPRGPESCRRLDPEVSCVGCTVYGYRAWP